MRSTIQHAGEAISSFVNAALSILHADAQLLFVVVALAAVVFSVTRPRVR